MRRRIRYKYKNLFFLGLSTFIAVFSLRNVFAREMLTSYLSSLGYFGTFVAGIFFTYGLTAPVAASVFILLSKTVNPFVASILGAFGAVLGDYLIFRFVKFNLVKEIDDLMSKGGIKLKEIRLSGKFRKIVPVIAGFIIASPLPDEIGSALFGLSEFETKRFLYFSYFLNLIGILSLILLGKVI
ncbi:MAG: hypothetical protein QW040_03165 [Candidatus Aenigmatarchaeota archaeon]